MPKFIECDETLTLNDSGRQQVEVVVVMLLAGTTTTNEDVVSPPPPTQIQSAGYDKDGASNATSNMTKFR